MTFEREKLQKKTILWAKSTKTKKKVGKRMLVEKKRQFLENSRKQESA